MSALIPMVSITNFMAWTISCKASMFSGLSLNHLLLIGHLFLKYLDFQRVFFHGVFIPFFLVIFFFTKL